MLFETYDSSHVRSLKSAYFRIFGKREGFKIVAELKEDPKQSKSASVHLHNQVHVSAMFKAVFDGFSSEGFRNIWFDTIITS